MKINDFNINNEKVMIFLHPMLASSEAMIKHITNRIGNGYRYIIPDLSAHGEESKKTYISSMDEAETLYNYLKKENIKKIEFAYGASLGGVVLFDLLKHNDIDFKHLFFEGPSFYEHARIRGCFLKLIMLRIRNVAIFNKEKAIRKMSAIYGTEVATAMVDQFALMDAESVKNIVKDCSFVNLPNMSKELQEKCVFSYGEKDDDLKQAKKVIPVKYPNAKLKIDERYGHCERISNDSEKYVDELMEEIDR